MFGAPSPIDQRLKTLQVHLEQENPVLLDVVKSFRQLDRVAYGLGMLHDDESFATRVPWWPMVAVLGTFSSGKSTFINGYLGAQLQQTGNQAVDDRFTVVCYSSDAEDRVLPGRALDADPRFPFYQMSTAIEAVSPGEGPRIDTYLQLKTCRSDALRGKIFIDSPGFDADEQRNSTLRLTDHIIDLADLVLVFFDARHPEPGAMQDTLEHLVGRTIARPDATKFLFILNQIDNAAREDNPEDVFAAWQRALAQKGLTAGRFYSIYSLDAAIHIENPRLRERFETKRATDMAEIDRRISQVEVERAYRIIGVLDQTARTIEDRVVPEIRAAKQRWRRRVTWLDAVLFGGILAAFLAVTISGGHWNGMDLVHPWYLALRDSSFGLPTATIALLALGIYAHFSVRKLAARMVRAGLRRDAASTDIGDWVCRAFDRNVRPWRGAFTAEPVGWSGSARKKIATVLADANGYVQMLNNRFANPSGHSKSDAAKRPRDIGKPLPAGSNATPAAPGPPVDYADPPPPDAGPETATRS